MRAKGIGREGLMEKGKKKAKRVSIRAFTEEGQGEDI